MFDIGWQEFILIALVAVVVVGPKDLPRVIRSVGQWIRKARSLASEFQGSLEEMAREAELDDVRRELQSASSGGIGATIEKHVDPDGEIRKSVEGAKAASGADEIKGALTEAREDVRTLAKGGDTPVTPTVEPLPGPASAAESSAAANAPVAAKAPKKPAAAKPAAKAPAATSTSKAAPKPAAKPRTAAADPSKPAAKPRRASKKPADTDSGKA